MWLVHVSHYMWDESRVHFCAPRYGTVKQFALVVVDETTELPFSITHSSVLFLPLLFIPHARGHLYRIQGNIWTVCEFGKSLSVIAEICSIVTKYSPKCSFRSAEFNNFEASKHSPQKGNYVILIAHHKSRRVEICRLDLVELQG